MANGNGSKDGSTWEEMVRNNPDMAHNRFSDQQTIKNLTVLKNWCEKKILELSSRSQIKE